MYKILTNGNFYKVQIATKSLIRGKGLKKKVIWEDLLGADLKPLMFGNVESARFFVDKDKRQRASNWKEVEVVR